MSGEGGTDGIDNAKDMKDKDQDPDLDDNEAFEVLDDDDLGI